MSRKPATASSFLTALSLDSPAAAGSPASEPVPIAPRAKSPGRPKKPTGSRTALKHIGGYLPDEAAERFARLKIRTKLGNDDLLVRAIDELWRIEGTKRKWDE